MSGLIAMCHGDCDRDSDCASGLKCFQRDGYTAIPGCWGRGKDDWDYCVHDDSVRITEVEVLGVEMDCPYSSFTDEDGNYAIPVLNPSGNLPVNMHAGIIPITTNIFDPNDVLLLQASSNKDPESLLIALNIKESSWTASDTNSASALGSENLPLTNVANGEVTSIDDSILGVGLNSRNVNGYGTGGLGKCQGDCDRDSDCASGVK